MDNIFDGVNDGVNDGGGNPTFNSKRTVSKEEQARILQAVKDTAQNNANREPINLKPVTIKAKKPLWANLEEKYTNEELAKLNATTKTLGMYIYGLSIGMDIKSITDILMSDVGRLFTKLLDGNLYENNLGTFSLNNTFNYFEIAPSSLINKYNKVIFSDDKAEGNPYIIFKDSLSTLIKD